MTAIFIGGSRRLGRVNTQLAQRLDNIIQRGFRVIVGDANGFDRAAQAYLSEHDYSAVVVYCTNGQCRNNVGGWPTRVVEYHGPKRNRDFYTAKDDAMLRDANYGLFAWDGESEGTLRNVRKMAEQGKPSTVYVSPIRQFVNVRSVDDAARLLMSSGETAAADLFSEA